MKGGNKSWLKKTGLRNRNENEQKVYTKEDELMSKEWVSKSRKQEVEGMTIGQ